MAGNNQNSAAINKLEAKKTVQGINKTKSSLRKSTSYINTPLAKLIKRHGNIIHNNKIRNEKGVKNTNWGN